MIKPAELSGRRVLVLDGELRSALAVVRSLGKSGATVIVGASSPQCLSAASKYVQAELIYADPKVSAAEFIEDLMAGCQRNQITDLLPMSEIALGTILKHADSFAGINLPYVDQTIYERAVNKHELAISASLLGIQSPHSIYCENAARADEDFLAALQYPVVLKPIKSRLFVNGQWLNTQVQYAMNSGELKQRLSNHLQYQHPFMVQEYVDGEGKGVFFLFDNGFELARFSHRRLREKPPTGGVSVLCESHQVEAALFEQAARLLGHLGWHGVAMVEFKVSSKGIPYLMEINPRFWGSLQLAIDAGVDFPRLLLAMKNKPIDAITSFKEGVKLRWLLGDLDRLLIVLRSSTYPLAKKVAELCSFLNFFSLQTNFETLRADDIRPFLREVKLYITDILRPRLASKKA